jgi:hypothetical protein
LGAVKEVGDGDVAVAFTSQKEKSHDAGQDTAAATPPEIDDDRVGVLAKATEL